MSEELVPVCFLCNRKLLRFVYKKRMQEMGLEPTRSCDHRHLKPARLPIPPLLHFVYQMSFTTAA